MTTTDLMSPEALAVIKGTPDTIGYRGGTLTLPRVLLLMSSGVDLSEKVPRPIMGEWLVLDFGRHPRLGAHFLDITEAETRGQRLRTDIHATHVVVYLESRDDPATVVRLFRALRGRCDAGLTLCDNRGEPLFADGAQ